MESQRIRLLTRGYLRGWLDFSYNNPTDHLRENIILSQVFDDEIAGMLKEKIALETALVVSLPNKTKDDFLRLYALYESYVGLKLPSLAKKDTIKEAESLPGETDFAEWRTFLENVNKKRCPKTK